MRPGDLTWASVASDLDVDEADCDDIIKGDCHHRCTQCWIKFE